MKDGLMQEEEAAADVDEFDENKSIVAAAVGYAW